MVNLKNVDHLEKKACLAETAINILFMSSKPNIILPKIIYLLK